MAKLDWVDGDDATMTGLSPDQAIVESQWAEDHDVSVGDTVTLLTTTGKKVPVHVVGSIRDRVQLLVTSLALPLETIRRQFDARQDFADLVGFAPGADDPRL